MATLDARDQILHINLEGRDPDDGSTLVPYQKGALLLRAIEERVGRQRFDEFLADYFQHFAFQSITTAQAVVYIQDKLFGGDASVAASLNIYEWLYEPGLPASAPDVHSSALASVEEKVAQWLNGTVSLSEVGLSELSAQEVQHFLNSLPLDLDFQRMRELDRELGLTTSRNNEMLQRWLLMVVHNGYKSAYPSLEKFLRSVGRRRYVKPLYEELVKSPKNRDLAISIYAEARPRYHPITQASVDAIIGSEHVREPTTPR